MNARQIANGTGSVVNRTAYFISRDTRVDALFKCVLGVLTFILAQNYFDWRDKIAQIPQIVAENAELKSQISAIPQQIERARPDPFTGTQGQLLEQRIGRTENDIEKLDSRITDLERTRRFSP